MDESLIRRSKEQRQKNSERHDRTTLYLRIRIGENDSIELTDGVSIEIEKRQGRWANLRLRIPKDIEAYRVHEDRENPPTTRVLPRGR